MASKSRQRAIVFSLLVIALAAVWWAIQLADPIRYGNSAKLEMGMSRDQVVELLGCEPGTHGFAFSRVNAVYASHGLRPHQWQGSRGTVAVYFDPKTDRVAHWRRWSSSGDPVEE